MGKKNENKQTSDKKQAKHTLVGRPKKKDNNQPSQVDIFEPCECQGNQNQITNHKSSVKLMKTLTHAGQVRYQTITGHKKALKAVVSKVEQISLRLFYFLAQKAKAKLTIQNGILYDKAEYVQIDKFFYEEQYHNLIDKINLVCKELDDDFIRELKLIIEIFIEFRQELMSEEELVNKILECIKVQEENFQYIIEWYHTKEKIYKEQLNFNKKQLEVELESNKYKHSHGRPKEKKEKIIRNKIEKINREIECDPLVYLIQRLVKVFQSELQSNGDQIHSESDSSYSNFPIEESLQQFSEYQYRLFK